MSLLRRLAPALVCLFAWSAAWAQPLVPVGTLKPTQMELGKKAAHMQVDAWRHDAKTMGLSLRAYAQTVLKPKFESTKLPMVIDPQGTYRNTDGHHRVSALRAISARTGVDFNVQPEILADYRGQSHGAYADHFINVLKKGQFTPKVEKLAPAERMKQLPDDYAKMKNNPMRTAVELVFEKVHIQGSMMRDYIEFRVGRRLIEDGFLDKLREKNVVAKNARKLPGHLADDKRVLDAIAKRLQRDDMRAFLLSEAKSPAIRQKIDKRIDEL
jgi:hypothetical protein